MFKFFQQNIGIKKQESCDDSDWVQTALKLGLFYSFSVVHCSAALKHRPMLSKSCTFTFLHPDCLFILYRHIVLTSGQFIKYE
jgi:hypothetical protein